MNHGSGVTVSLPAGHVAPLGGQRENPAPVAAQDSSIVSRPASPSRALWNLAGVGVALLAAVLLLIPGGGPLWSVALAVVGVVALVARWVADLFRFDYDFSMVHLTEEELAQDLDW